MFYFGFLVGYFKEGKGSIPIAERARRIYSPGKSHTAKHSHASSSTDSFFPAARASKTVGGEVNGGDTGIGTESDVFMGRGIVNNQNLNTRVGSVQYDEDFEKPSVVESVQRREDADDDNSVDDTKIYGLKLDTADFDDQNLFDGFKPIFDPPVTAPPLESTYKVASKTVNNEPGSSGGDENGVVVGEGTDNNTTVMNGDVMTNPQNVGGPGRFVKMNLELAPAVDLLT